MLLLDLRHFSYNLCRRSKHLGISGNLTLLDRGQSFQPLSQANIRRTVFSRNGIGLLGNPIEPTFDHRCTQRRLTWNVSVYVPVAHIQSARDIDHGEFFKPMPTKQYLGGVEDAVAHFTRIRII